MGRCCRGVLAAFLFLAVVEDFKVRTSESASERSTMWVASRDVVYSRTLYRCTLQSIITRNAHSGLYLPMHCMRRDEVRDTRGFACIECTSSRDAYQEDKYCMNKKVKDRQSIQYRPHDECAITTASLLFSLLLSRDAVFFDNTQCRKCASATLRRRGAYPTYLKAALKIWKPGAYLPGLILSGLLLRVLISLTRESS